MKFFIKTLGCKVNQYDSLALKRKLISVGFLWDQKDPDVVVVNTCAVTKNAIKKDKRILNDLKKKNPKAKTVLMGCWPETYPKDQAEKDVDLVWGTGKLEKLTEKIREAFGFEKDDHFLGCFEVDPPKEGERSRYFLKIQDGCEQFCSYCNIPYARGKMRSRPKDEVLDEIEKATKKGFEEIILCGVHLGLYGREKNSKTCNLLGLLKEVVKIEGLGRVRLSSIEVNDLHEELLEFIAKEKKICEHLHISLQSGCDKILKAMNRPYSTEYFEKIVENSRKLMPNIAITTDVIVGFPGETKEDFKETVNFCKKMRFSKIHVFPFSAHEKTPAAKMKNQLSNETKKQRADLLRDISALQEEEFGDRFKGGEVEILVEKVEEEIVSGKTEHYIGVSISKSKLETKKPISKKDIGRILKARIL